MRFPRQTFILAVSTIVLTTGFVEGQEQPSDPPKNGAKAAEQKEVDIRELTIHPAAETKPALRDHLVPSYLDQTPRNAAPLYLRAFVMLGEIPKGEDDDERVARWLHETPLEELPIAEAKMLLARYQNAIAEVEAAALRERCEWDLPIRESGTDLFAMLLPDVQHARQIGRLLVLRARLEIAEGEFEQAVGTLRTVLTLSRHVAEQPFLVCGLVGLAISRQALEVVEDFAQSEQAPNLYWPLTNLPQPRIDLGPGVHLEYVAVYLVFPELRDVESGEYSNQEWDRRAARLLGRGKGMASLFGGEGQGETVQKISSPQAVDDAHADARARLLERGYRAVHLDAMPKSRVVLLDIAESFAETRDEMYKAFGLPYPQAKQVLEEAEKALNRSETRGYGGQLAAMLLPAMRAVKRASARGQLDVDALRCIEALRMHAAEHGELPAELDDVTAAPVPLNPLTGNPFVYRLEDGVATLDLEDEVGPVMYRVRLAN